MTLSKEFNRVACPDAPLFEPEKWDSGWYKMFNNCYAYAVNDCRVDRCKPQPGGVCGKQYENMQKIDLARAAIHDGLLWAQEPVQEKGYYLVALLVWPGQDYHWVRQDRDGDWSHKSGRLSVSRLDFEDKSINAPHLAEWEKYEFTGYFYVPKGGIKVEDRWDDPKLRAPAPVPKGFTL